MVLLTKKSRPVKQHRAILQNREISGSEPAYAVKGVNPLFKDLNPHEFCVCYTKQQSELGLTSSNLP